MTGPDADTVDGRSPSRASGLAAVRIAWMQGQGSADMARGFPAPGSFPFGLSVASDWSVSFSRLSQFHQHPNQMRACRCLAGQVPSTKIRKTSSNLNIARSRVSIIRDWTVSGVGATAVCIKVSEWPHCGSLAAGSHGTARGNERSHLEVIGCCHTTSCPGMMSRFAGEVRRWGRSQTFQDRW